MVTLFPAAAYKIIGSVLLKGIFRVQSFLFCFLHGVRKVASHFHVPHHYLNQSLINMGAKTEGRRGNYLSYETYITLDKDNEADKDYEGHTKWIEWDMLLIGSFISFF